MPNLSKTQIGLIIAGVAIVGVGAAFMSGVFNPLFTDGGVDVRNTKCENITSARIAISNELENRKTSAWNKLAQEKDTISDAYWSKNQSLEAEYHQCISNALTADPCKAPFEEIGRLYEEIMADFEAGKGFNEAKFNEREEAKKEYNKCVEDARKPEFYKDKETACNEALAAGKEANQADRTQKEQSAETRYQEALANAQSAYQNKSAILDAIEEKCKESGGSLNVNIGAINTQGTGTAIQSSSSSCTGIFEGNNPDLKKRLADLESQLQKAKAAGMSDGLFGTSHIQQSIDDLKQELKDSQRSCKIDADCGNPEPVCCGQKEVGQSYCSNGVCASKKTECVDPEICAGKPAMCVAPDIGVKQQEGVYISRTIPEVGSCSQNLKTLNLQKGTADSNRYSIVGNIPEWLHIDKPSGTLPGTADITYSCGTVQGFGPGVYNVGGSITVYNASNELINTIPFNVSITVTASEKKIDVIEYNGKYLPTSQLIIESESGCDGGVDHWHASTGVVTATDGTKVSDPGPQCGYGKVKDRPIIQVTAPKTELKGEVRGLESLKAQ